MQFQPMSMEPTNFRFYKTVEGEWYVDLPEWEGSREDLQMVAGADNWLDIMSEGDYELVIRLSDQNFPGSYPMFQTKPGDTGMYYHIPQYMDIKFGLNIWLCDVTRFVFGYFPEKIYFCRWF
jgi:hypothetical protein